MSIFSITIKKAIQDYRFLLRRYLPQAERMTKLQKLRLKKKDTYESDFSLYQAASNIVADIEKNMLNADQGYYSYSGIEQFCQYLKDYLNDYMVENGVVIHRTRNASRALLHAIQLASTPREQLDERIAKKLFESSKEIVQYGTPEQFDLYSQALESCQAKNPGFYTRIIAHFESLRASKEIEKDHMRAA